MPLTLQQIEAEAARLPVEERRELMLWLHEHDSDHPDPQWQSEWETEIARRLGDVDTGRVTMVDGDKVMEEIRAFLPKKPC